VGDVAYGGRRRRKNAYLSETRNNLPPLIACGRGGGKKEGPPSIFRKKDL